MTLVGRALRWWWPFWWMAMVGDLVYLLITYKAGAGLSVGHGFLYALLLLNFPISLLVSALVLSLLAANARQSSPLVGEWVTSLDHSLTGFVLLWGVYLLAGLLQWGGLLRLWRK